MLSEEDKKRIEEEEYRKSIAGEYHTKNSSANSSPYKSETLGIIALILPICGACYAWISMSNTTVLGSFLSNTLATTIAIVILGSSVLVAIEANNVGAGGDKDFKKNSLTKKRESPITWFFALVLLWAICFPMWMYRRSEYGLKNYLGVSIAVVIVFALAMMALGEAISEAQRSYYNSIRW